MANSFQNKCRKIAAEIIKKSFPDLKNKKILVFTTSFLEPYSGMTFWLFWPVPRMIFINKHRDIESINYLRGLLCHELCHLALVEYRGFLKSALLGLLYWPIPKLRRREEDATNKLAIQRGYSKEIYLITKKAIKRKTSKNIQRHYMNHEEIKSYAKSIKKW